MSSRLGWYGCEVRPCTSKADANQNRDLDAAYSYDTEGKMTSVNYPTTYSYVYPNLVATAGPTYTYSYDSASRPIGLTGQNNYAGGP